MSTNGFILLTLFGLIYSVTGQLGSSLSGAFSNSKAKELDSLSQLTNGVESNSPNETLILPLDNETKSNNAEFPIVNAESSRFFSSPPMADTPAIPAASALTDYSQNVTKLWTDFNAAASNLALNNKATEISSVNNYLANYNNIVNQFLAQAAQTNANLAASLTGGTAPSIPGLPSIPSGLGTGLPAVPSGFPTTIQSGFSPPITGLLPGTPSALSPSPIAGSSTNLVGNVGSVNGSTIPNESLSSLSPAVNESASSLGTNVSVQSFSANQVIPSIAASNAPISGPQLTAVPDQVSPVLNASLPQTFLQIPQLTSEPGLFSSVTQVIPPSIPDEPFPQLTVGPQVSPISIPSVPGPFLSVNQVIPLSQTPAFIPFLTVLPAQAIQPVIGSALSNYPTAPTSPQSLASGTVQAVTGVLPTSAVASLGDPNQLAFAGPVSTSFTNVGAPFLQPGIQFPPPGYVPLVLPPQQQQPNLSSLLPYLLQLLQSQQQPQQNCPNYTPSISPCALAALLNGLQPNQPSQQGSTTSLLPLLLPLIQNCISVVQSAGLTVG